MKENKGLYVADEDWDNLIILDGCRFDLFSETIDSYDLGGELRKVASRGAGSPEFLRENFNRRELDDVVYVSANPFVRKVLDSPFHHTEHVWLTKWDEELETVTPSVMIEETVRLSNEFPNKKIISHFMQPHHPFIGEKQLESDPGFVGARAKSLDEEVPEARFVWEQLRQGKVTKSEVWEAYQDNLKIVLDQIGELIDELQGKTVITSDHGNALGERASPFPTRVYGHGDRIHIPALLEVPWYELPYTSRKSTISEKLEKNEQTTTDNKISERLESLGYLDQ
ncbi:alkaline phosphatase family protein [Halorubrum ezzemoulense]|uniref:LTA synthase family protein n=1 Tax=Halorubrum ezzemoulense TaxID=337243 RepID=UPI00111C2AD5|nr:LTA synthase family protein [Halorubrum ezzemoulense]